MNIFVCKSIDLSGKQASGNEQLLQENRHTQEPYNILVHFEFNEIKFPKKLSLSSDDFDELYSKVISAFQTKVPSYDDSYSVQYQCGTKWYDFKADTGYDCLCLDDKSPEIRLRATSTAIVSGTYKMCCLMCVI